MSERIIYPNCGEYNSYLFQMWLRCRIQINDHPIGEIIIILLSGDDKFKLFKVENRNYTNSYYNGEAILEHKFSFNVQKCQFYSETTDIRNIKYSEEDIKNYCQTSDDNYNI